MVLLSRPVSQPLAFLYLSQIPYTGFGSGPVAEVVFFTLILGWSALASYFLTIKGWGARMLAIMGGTAAMSMPSFAPMHPVPAVPASRPVEAKPERAPAPAVPAPVIEEASTESKDVRGVLVFEHVPGSSMPRLRLVEKPQAQVKMFNPVISPIQPEIPAYSASSPTVAPALSTLSSTELLKAVAGGNDEGVYAAIRGADAQKMICDAAVKLDVLYRARVERRPLSGELASAFGSWSAKALEELISFFTCAADYTYSNRETPVKLSLMKAVDLAKRVANPQVVGSKNDLNFV